MLSLTIFSEVGISSIVVSLCNTIRCPVHFCITSAVFRIRKRFRHLLLLNPLILFRFYVFLFAFLSLWSFSYWYWRSKANIHHDKGSVCDALSGDAQVFSSRLPMSGFWYSTIMKSCRPYGWNVRARHLTPFKANTLPIEKDAIWGVESRRLNFGTKLWCTTNPRDPRHSHWDSSGSTWFTKEAQSDPLMKELMCQYKYEQILDVTKLWLLRCLWDWSWSTLAI